jgi:hypothetical protein
MKYSITSQADLENIPVRMVAGDTATLTTDIALDGNWTPIGSMTGTLDGAGHKITNLTTRAWNAAYATQANDGTSITSKNLGKTHSIFFRAAASGTGTFSVIGSYSKGHGVIWNSTTIWYYASGAYVYWSRARTSTPTDYAIVRSGKSVTLYSAGVSRGTKTITNNDLVIEDFLKTEIGTWTCSLSQVVFTSDAKSAADVTFMRNSGLGRIATSASMTNITAIWSLNEGSGTTGAESISSATMSGIDGWGSEEAIGGLVNSTSGTVKNLKIENPVVSGAGLQLGIFANSFGGTLENCAVSGTTGTLAYTKNSTSGAVGGLVGSANAATIRNCYVSLASMTTVNSQRFGGAIGNIDGGGTYENIYTVGGGTAAPRHGLIGYLGNYGNVRNNWSGMTATVKELFGDVIGTGTFTNNYFYDQSLGETRGTAVATLTDFYNITQAPMTSWDFTPTGSWSKSKDGTDYPVFNAYFSGDISGTVTGWTSGKTVKLVTKSNSVAPYYNKAVGTLSSAINLGSTFTVAFIVGDTPAQGTIWGLLYKDVKNFITYDGAVSNCTLRMRVADADISTEINQNVDLRGRHRVVFVKTAGAASKIYYDGRLLKMNAYANPINSNSFNGLAYLLRQYSSPSPSGVISEVVMFNDAKDQAWVTADYGNGDIKKYTSGDTGIVEGFHLDEGTGSVCTSFVTARTVTISPAPIWTDNIGYTIYNTTTATTTGSGDFTLSSINGACGLPCLIYIDDASVQGSIVATLPDGLMGNVTGLAFAQDSVQIGDAKLHPAMTTTLLNLASIYGFADNNFRLSGTTLYYNNGCDCLIPTGCYYAGIIQPDTAETGDILVDGTATLSGTVNGLTNTGTLTFTTGTVNGDIDNSGTFTANDVQLQVYSPTITNTGTMILRAVFKDDTAFVGDITLTSPNFSVAGKTYTFEHGKTYSYDTLTIAGAVGNEIALLSDSAGSRFTLDGSGANISAVDIKNCQASTADIFVTRGINSGGNDNREATPHLVFLAYQQAFITELATA